MTKDNTESRELLSPEDQAVLNRARQLNQKQVVVMYDSLKFKDSEKKVLDINGVPLPRGSYFIESYDPDKEEGKRKTFRDIGPNPEIVILHRAYTYSQYVEGKGLVAWTSDIQGFGPDDFVQVYSRKDGGKAIVEFTGTYPELKDHLARHYVTHHPSGKDEKLMTFQNLLYVLFEGKVLRMFVSNASASGIAAGAKGPDFKKPQPLSLLSFIETTKREQGGALCEYVCKLGSWFKDDVEQPYYIRTFTNAGKNPHLPAAVKEVKEILMEVMRGQKDIMTKRNAAEVREEVVHDAEVVDGGMPTFD